MLGIGRLVLEILAGGGTELGGAAAWIVGVNFLHYAILIFAACVVVLVGVSLATAPPPPGKIAGLTFATAREGEGLEGAPIEVSRPINQSAGR